jgi:DNA-binding NtrC family response regulator
VLEDGSLRRVGSHQERRVSVRLIAATNRNLSQEVSKKNFREDLFYRINVVSIELPRLQDRPGDVNCLIDYYLSDPWTIDDSAREAMNQYSWPGNVRQLMNVLQRATVLADHQEITLDDLPSEIAHAAVATSQGISKWETEHSSLTSCSTASDCSRLKPTIGDPQVKLDELAQAHILEVLAKEDGNKAAAARKLGIHRRKLYRLLERFERAASRKGECNTC